MSSVTVKLGLGQGATPLSFTALAGLLAALLFLPWTWRFRLPEGKDRARLAVAFLSGNLVAPLAIAYGLTQASALTAALLVDSELVTTAVLAWVLLGERTTRREAGALLVVFLGALVVALAALGGEGAASTALGVGLVALGTTSFSLDNVLTTPLTRKLDLRAMMGARLLAGGLVHALLALALAGPAFPPLASLPAALFQAAFGIGAALLLFWIGLREIGATRATVLFGTAPFWGALAAALVLDEPLGPTHLAGGLLMALGVGGLALAARHRTRRRDARAHAPNG